jgi:trimeric autotransporter adhesin
MSLGNTSIHQQGEIPEITKLPNGRIRVIRRFVKFTREDVDNVNLGSLLGDFGDLDATGEQIVNQGYTDCRLISVEVEQSTKRSSGTDTKDNVLVQTYETLTNSFVEITDPIIEISENGLKKVTRVYRAVSQTASTGVVGTTEYTSDATVTTLASSKIEDNTALAELTEIYLESGIIRISVERDSDSQIVVVNCIGLTQTEVSLELTTLIGNHEFTSEVTENVDGFETNSFTYKIKDLTTLEATSDDLNLIRKIELSATAFSSGVINATDLTFGDDTYTLRKEEINNIGIIKKRARIFALYDESSFPSNELYEIDRTYGIALPVARQTVPAATATGQIGATQVVQIEPIDSFRSLSYKILAEDAAQLPTQIWYEKRNVSVFPSELESIKIVGTQNPTVVINYKEPAQVGLVAKITRQFHWGVPNNSETVIGNNYNPQPFSDAIEVDSIRESTSVTNSTSANTGTGTSANTSNSTSASQGTTQNTSNSNSSSNGTSQSTGTSTGTSSGTSSGTSTGTSNSTSSGTNSSTNSGSSTSTNTSTGTSSSSSSGTSNSNNSSTGNNTTTSTSNFTSNGNSNVQSTNNGNSSGTSNSNSSGSGSGSSNSSSNNSGNSSSNSSGNSGGTQNSSNNGTNNSNVTSNMQTTVNSTGNDGITSGSSSKNTQSRIDAVPSPSTPTRYTESNNILGSTSFSKDSNGSNNTSGNSNTTSNGTSNSTTNSTSNTNSTNNTTSNYTSNSTSNSTNNTTNNSSFSGTNNSNNTSNSVSISTGLSTSIGTNISNGTSTNNGTNSSTSTGTNSGTSSGSGSSTSTSTSTSTGTNSSTQSSNSSGTSSNTGNSSSTSSGTNSGTSISASTSSGTSNNTNAVQSQSTGTSNNTSNNTSQSTSTTNTDTKTIISVNMRACLRTAKSISFDGQTINIPATVPTSIPRDTFIEIERSSSHWKYNIWVEQIVEVKLPADSIPVELP